MVHEEFFSALELAGVSPGGEHLRRLHVVVQRLGHLRSHIAFGGLVTFSHLHRAFCCLPVGQRGVVGPLAEQQVDRIDVCPLRGVGGHVAGGPRPQDLGDGLVGQRIGVVLHGGQVSGWQVGAGVGSGHGATVPGARQRWKPASAHSSGIPMAKAAMVRISTGLPRIIWNTMPAA